MIVPVEDGFYTFAQSEQLLDSHLFVRQGTRTAAGGCDFAGVVHLNRTHPILKEDELGYNPATCQMRVLQGVPAPAAALPYTICCGGGGGGPYRIYGYGQVKDPANINLNDVKNFLTWSGGACANNISYPTTQYSWLWQDGWAKVSGSDTHGYPQCAQASQSTLAQYQNYPFCHVPNDPTNAYYHWITIIGYYGGNADASWNIEISGGCASLLHYNEEAGYY